MGPTKCSRAIPPRSSPGAGPKPRLAAMSPESPARQDVRLPSPAEPLQDLERWPEGGSERQGFVGLDRNERPSPLPDWFIEKLRAALTSETLVNYPAVDTFHRNLAGSL